MSLWSSASPIGSQNLLLLTAHNYPVDSNACQEQASCLKVGELPVMGQHRPTLTAGTIQEQSQVNQLAMRPTGKSKGPQGRSKNQSRGTRTDTGVSESLHLFSLAASSYRTVQSGNAVGTVWIVLLMPISLELEGCRSTCIFLLCYALKKNKCSRTWDGKNLRND